MILYYTREYHKKYFQKLCDSLCNYTEKCTVSFVDLYKNTERNTKSLNIHTPSNEEVLELMSFFSKIAHENGIYIDTCTEEYDLSSLNIKIKEAFADVLKVLILECITPVKMAVCTVMQISTVKWHEKTITNITHYLH